MERASRSEVEKVLLGLLIRECSDRMRASGFKLEERVDLDWVL